MDPQNIGEMFKHLDSQNEMLEQYRMLMLHELEKLQVEHEMLMCKFYELMKSQMATRKNQDVNNVSDNGKAALSLLWGVLTRVTSNDYHLKSVLASSLS